MCTCLVKCTYGGELLSLYAYNYRLADAESFPLTQAERSFDLLKYTMHGKISNPSTSIQGLVCGVFEDYISLSTEFMNTSHQNFEILHQVLLK
ncbi:unnamed protein product [Heterobilharzia americana]|nr:unnamed protein product [Heterobilharzia americana]